MPMQTRFERDVQKVVDEKMNLDPEGIAARLDTMEGQIAGKANINHTHSIAQVNGLSEALNDKANASSVATLTTRVNTAENDIDALSTDVGDLSTDVAALSVNVSNKANIVGGAVQLTVYASTALPGVSPAGRLVFVSDLKVLAVSDGTSWLNTQTGAAI